MVRTLVTWLLLATALFVQAQFPFTRSVEVRLGQSRPRITCLALDTHSALWTGSDLGLLRTDGERVDAMWRTAPHRITALTRQGDRILAMVSSGVLLQCGDLGCDTLALDSLWSQDAVRAIVADAQGSIWVATFGDGVHRIGVKGRTRIGTEHGLPDLHVNDLALFADGRLVAATDQGLALITGDSVQQVFEQRHGAPDNLVLSVSVDHLGQVWAGTAGAGVFIWTPRGGPVRTTDLVGDVGAVQHVLAAQGRLWAATEGAGLMVLEGDGQGRYQYLPEHPKNAVSDLVLDRHGVVWWCDGTDRIHRSDPRVLHVPAHEGVDLRRVTAICGDAQGRMWFANADGAFVHSHAFSDAARLTRIPVPLPASTPLVSLSADDQGHVWGASFGGGLWQLDGTGGAQRVGPPAAPGDPNILSVRADRGTIWTATLSGISGLQQGLNSDLGALGTGFVYHVAPSSGGTMLAATDGNGVLRIRDRTLTELIPTGPRTFYTVAEDATGAIWAGGPATGLCKAEGSQWAQRGAEVGLIQADIHAIVPFLDQVFVLGDRGVLSFDPARAQWTDLTDVLGLEDLQMELNCTALDTAGALWVASDRGLVRILPDRSLLEAMPPPSILEVRLGDQRLRADTLYGTAHDKSALSVRFMAPGHAGAGALQFEYRLIGLTNEVMRTRERELTFPALPPGTYRFELRALHMEGEVPSEWVGFGLVVDPPWWQRPWIIALMVIASMAVVLSLIAARDRRVHYRQRMEQEQVRFQLEALRSQVDPHFLFNSFNTLVELIETEPEKAVLHVDQLSTFFRNILQVRDRELITLKEELELLNTYFGLEQRRFGEAIALNVEVPEALRSTMIVPLTLQLLVENAIKHNAATKRTPVIVTITAVGQDLELHNTLIPKLSPPRSTGFGLDSIRKRYQALTPRPVHVERTAGSFVVRIPLIPHRP